MTTESELSAVLARMCNSDSSEQLCALALMHYNSLIHNQPKDYRFGQWALATGDLYARGGALEAALKMYKAGEVATRHHDPCHVRSKLLERDRAYASSIAPSVISGKTRAGR